MDSRNVPSLTNNTTKKFGFRPLSVRTTVEAFFFKFGSLFELGFKNEKWQNFRNCSEQLKILKPYKEVRNELVCLIGTDFDNFRTIYRAEALKFLDICSYSFT